MRIPFTRDLSIGTDIVRIQRIRDLIWNKALPTPQKERIPRFLTRILHPKERLDFNARFPGLEELLAVESNIRTRNRENTARWLAGRWAAKEAAKKAWGATKLGFKDVRVEICADGQVQVVCHGKIFTHNGELDDAEQVGKLSISHDGDYATATVLATPLGILFTDDAGNNLSLTSARKRSHLRPEPELPPIRKVNLNFAKDSPFDAAFLHEGEMKIDNIPSEAERRIQGAQTRDLQQWPVAKGLDSMLDALKERQR